MKRLMVIVHGDSKAELINALNGVINEILKGHDNMLSSEPKNQFEFDMIENVEFKFAADLYNMENVDK